MLKTEIILALKAFSTHACFPIIREYLSGTTASSVFEANLAQEFGKSVHLYSPAYKPAEMETLTSIASHITFNSLLQWNTFVPRLKKEHPSIQLGLRLNPEHSEVQTALYDPCCSYSRLGITARELGDFIPDELDGIHIHNLCLILQMEEEEGKDERYN